MPILACATARVQSEQEVAKMAEDMFRDRITDPGLCEALMLKGALMHRHHVSYLATALIFALKIMCCLTVGGLQLQ